MNNLGYNRTGLTMLSICIVLSVVVSLWWILGIVGLWLYAEIVG